MVDTPHTQTDSLSHSHSRFDPVWTTIGVITLLLTILDVNQMMSTVRFAGRAILGMAPFILFAILTIGGLKASGSETLIAKAFTSNQLGMIVVAALLGGLSPFCSCEVITFSAALLMLGTPLSAVMAFWLTSPLMDPAMFLINAGTLGWDFASAKTLAIIAIGLFGGAVTMALADTSLLRAPLRDIQRPSACCRPPQAFQGQPVWDFWRVTERRQTFVSTVRSNGLFLFKWLSLAYVLEALILRYIPTGWIGSLLGGEDIGTIILAGLIGVPAYMNGYTAILLVDPMLTQGISAGAAMSFIIAGGIICIPATVAVWALVKPKVFIVYLIYATLGAFGSGMAWQTASGWLIGA